MPEPLVIYDESDVTCPAAGEDWWPRCEWSRIERVAPDGN